MCLDGEKKPNHLDRTHADTGGALNSTQKDPSRTWTCDLFAVSCWPLLQRGAGPWTALHINLLKNIKRIVVRRERHAPGDERTVTPQLIFLMYVVFSTIFFQGPWLSCLWSIKTWPFDSNYAATLAHPCEQLALGFSLLWPCLMDGSHVGLRSCVAFRVYTTFSEIISIGSACAMHLSALFISFFLSLAPSRWSLRCRQSRSISLLSFLLRRRLWV